MREFFQSCADAALAGVPAPSVPVEHHALIREGAEKFAAALAGASELDYEPNVMPVLSSSLSAGTKIGERFNELAVDMPWSAGRGDPDGVRRAIVHVNDLFDLGDVNAGLLYSSAGDLYPEHNHPPQEMYIMLEGTGDWRFGGATNYVPVPPGQTIYNNPFDVHGVRSPHGVLALWVLWGAG